MHADNIKQTCSTLSIPARINCQTMAGFRRIPIAGSLKTPVKVELSMLFVKQSRNLNLVAHVVFVFSQKGLSKKEINIFQLFGR